MKPRLKMDGLLLALVVIFSLGVYLFPKLFYAQSRVDDILDFFGMLMILTGSFIRMSARGHKVACSPKGWGLAQDGLYAYTRNPMYLGTFTIGVGFTFIIWPWWAAFIFAVLFYLRFRPLIASEEKHLKTIFPEEYEQYCNCVPRIFPSIMSLLKINLAYECPWHELWQTKERRTVWTLPLIIFIAEIMKEWVLYQVPPSRTTFLPFVLAIAVFSVILAIEYFLKDGKNPK